MQVIDIYYEVKWIEERYVSRRFKTGILCLLQYV